MLLEVPLRRKERVERVARAESAAEEVRRAAVLLPGLAARDVAVAVETQMRGECNVPYVRRTVRADVPPRGRAHRERRALRIVEIRRNGEPLALRHDGAPAREPPHAAVGLEQLIHAIQHPALPANDIEIPTLNLDAERILLVGRGLWTRRHGGSRTPRPTAIIPQIHRLPRRNIAPLANNRQLYPGHPAHVVAQLLGGVPHRRPGRRLNHDGVLRLLSAFRKDDFAPFIRHPAGFASEIRQVDLDLRERHRCDCRCSRKHGEESK